MKKIILAAFVAASTLFSACDQNARKPELHTEADSLAYLAGTDFFYNSIGQKKQLLDALHDMGSDSAFVNEFIRGLEDGFNSAEEKKQIAYFTGANLGTMMRLRCSRNLDYLVYGNDSTQHVELHNVLIGFMDALNDTIQLRSKEGKALDAQQSYMLFMELQRKVYEKRMTQQYKQQMEAETAFFNKLKKNPEVKALENGVFYKELVKGEGSKAMETDPSTYKVEFEGRMTNGHVFDKTGPEGLKSQPIPGIMVALSQMNVGDEWEVYIPSTMAYGVEGQGDIPPYTPVIFKMKVSNK